MLKTRLGVVLAAPSCSLLHVPVDLAHETALDADIRASLAFAVQKLDELAVLKRALNEGEAAVADKLQVSRAAFAARAASARVHRPEVQKRLRAVSAAMAERSSPYTERAERQRTRFHVTTTTIGSFPQTDESPCALRFQP